MNARPGMLSYDAVLDLDGCSSWLFPSCRQSGNRSINDHKRVSRDLLWCDRSALLSAKSKVQEDRVQRGASQDITASC